MNIMLNNDLEVLFLIVLPNSNHVMSCNINCHLLTLLQQKVVIRVNLNNGKKNARTKALQIAVGVQGNHFFFLSIVNIEPNLHALYILVYSPNYFN